MERCARKRRGLLLDERDCLGELPSAPAGAVETLQARDRTSGTSARKIGEKHVRNG